MLDVSMMGTAVIVAALSHLRANGVVISLDQGMFPLLGAELCHYAIAFIASRAVNCAALPQDSEAGLHCKGVAASGNPQVFKVMEVFTTSSSTFETESQSQVSTSAVDDQASSSADSVAAMV